MKSVSKAGLAAVLGFAVAAAAAPVFAGERHADPGLSDPGLKVTYQPKTGRYCIRPTSEEAAIRTGTRLYRAECRSRQSWATLGLTIAT